MVGTGGQLEMGLVASVAQEGRTVNTVDLGVILLTQLTLDIIGINRFLLDGCGHHPSSEVVGGEILSPPLWKLERTMALGTLDFPTGG